MFTFIHTNYVAQISASFFLLQNSWCKIDSLIAIADCTNVFPRSRTEKRVSSALELARKITKYNNRHKTTGITAQETELQAAPAPILVPRTPVQPYPYHPWQPSGDCLSSTKVKGSGTLSNCMWFDQSATRMHAEMIVRVLLI